MSNWEAIILGVIQGLTEFLPVSSSGHLALTQQMFGLKETPLFYDVLLHLATLLATLLVLRKQVFGLLKASLRLPRFVRSLFSKGHLAIADDAEAWVVCLIFLSTLVTGGIGFFGRDWFVEAFASTRVVAGGLFVTGLALFFSRKAGRTDSASGSRYGARPKSAVLAKPWDAVMIGLAQGLAILPGISRSGATITTGLFLGFERKFAGEYAFLVSLPAIIGAVILEGRDGFSELPVSLPVAALGFLLALTVGALSLRLLLGWIRNGKLHFFAFYCWFVAGMALFLSF